MPDHLSFPTNILPDQPTELCSKPCTSTSPDPGCSNTLFLSCPSTSEMSALEARTDFTPVVPFGSTCPGPRLTASFVNPV